MPSAGPIRLADLTADRARRVLDQNPRLLVPVGTLVVRGPHLPLATDTIITERLADDLSARFGIPRAPTIPFGVHADHDLDSPGSAALTRKTLHRVMNELIAGWETEAKVREVLILTAHAGDAHLEALSTIRSVGRVTVLDIYGAPLDDLGAGQSPDTAIMLWLAPTLVDADLIPAAITATAPVGEQIYHRILERLARFAG